MTTTEAPSMDTVALLAELVAFDTTSRNPNTALIDRIGRYLEYQGVAYTLNRGPEDGKWNLHALIGPQKAGGLAFSGHLDTVPVDGQDWTSDPFILTEQGDRLIARGATDMKGFVACMLAAIPDIMAMPLREPVHFFFTFDEEITCNGARYLIEDVKARGLLPTCCVVGEPTSLAPVIAHKGRVTLRVDITGKPAHSSQPARGVNALHAMGEAIAAIGRLAEDLAMRGPRHAGFDPDYSTMQVGLAQGGTILNIVPQKASFEMEWRNVPEDDNQSLLQRVHAALAPIDSALRTADPKCGLTVTPLVDLPPLALPENDPLVALLQQVTGRNSAGYVSYGTEAGIYQQAGLPTIVCGPGDIAQAHKPDEWITRDQLTRCDAIIRSLVTRVCLDR